jgi:hypothetical protein
MGLGKIGGTPASPLAGGLPPLVDSDRRLAAWRGLPTDGLGCSGVAVGVSQMHDRSQHLIDLVPVRVGAGIEDNAKD